MCQPSASSAIEWVSQPPLISATIITAVSHMAQRVLRSASGLPSSKTWLWRQPLRWLADLSGEWLAAVITVLYPSIFSLRRITGMAHTIHAKKPLLARVRRIKGQAEALERALLQQIAAIRGAVNGLMAEVLEGHVREHLGAADVSAAQRQEDLDVVLAALRSYMR